MENQSYSSFLRSIMHDEAVTADYISYLESKILKLQVNKVPIGGTALMDLPAYAVKNPKYALFEQYLSMVALPLRLPLARQINLQEALYKAPEGTLEKRVNDFLDNEGAIKVVRTSDFRRVLINRIFGEKDDFQGMGDASTSMLRIAQKAIFLGGNCPYATRNNSLVTTAIIISSNPISAFEDEQQTRYAFCHLVLVAHDSEAGELCKPAIFQLYYPGIYKTKADKVEEQVDIFTFRPYDLFTIPSFRGYAPPTNGLSIIRTAVPAVYGLLFPHELNDKVTKFETGVIESLIAVLNDFIENEVIAQIPDYSSLFYLKKLVGERLYAEQAQMKSMRTQVAGPFDTDTATVQSFMQTEADEIAKFAASRKRKPAKSVATLDEEIKQRSAVDLTEEEEEDFEALAGDNIVDNANDLAERVLAGGSHSKTTMKRVKLNEALDKIAANGSQPPTTIAKKDKGMGKKKQ